MAPLNVTFAAPYYTATLLFGAFQEQFYSQGIFSNGVVRSGPFELQSTTTSM